MPLSMMEEARKKLGEIPEIKVVHLHLLKNEMKQYGQIHRKMVQNKDGLKNKLGKRSASEAIKCWIEKKTITKNRLPNIVCLH